jgi:hypothetical protein
MYVACNQDKNDKKGKNDKQEAFINMGKPVNELPNVPKRQPDYYPKKEKGFNTESVNQYLNANAVTDKYFNEIEYANKVDKLQNKGKLRDTLNNNDYSEIDGSNKTPMVSSLTGIPIDETNFQHNNMVPFFGSKMTGAAVDSTSLQYEGMLDNLSGAGSQQFEKKEVAPLFKPEDNVNWANGAPNNTDFMMSRMNPSTRMANVKVWEEERVAPGLNNGYTTCGSGGFNSGLEARADYMPKTVDELRVKTNPKLTFGLANHEGPANSLIKNPGIMGKMEKHLPDTYYANNPNRWLTTTGLEKAQTARGIEVLQDVNRPSTTREHFGSGAAKQKDGTYVKGQFEQPSRPELQCNAVTNYTAAKYTPASTGDYGQTGYEVPLNNRHTTDSERSLGFIGGIIKSAMAPITDILRPTRKENVIGNARPSGNAGSEVNAPTVYNPADRTRTTIREMTENKLDFTHLNVENQIDGAYKVSPQQSVNNQRDTTNAAYTGISGGERTRQGSMNYNAGYNQRNNVNKMPAGRINPGSASIFEARDNVKIDKRDCDRDNNRMWGTTDSIKNLPSVAMYGQMKTPQNYDQNINKERMNPDILTAFKNNPYTQSLQSWA